MLTPYFEVVFNESLKLIENLKRPFWSAPKGTMSDDAVHQETRVLDKK
jgi:hypothetical protein